MTDLSTGNATIDAFLSGSVVSAPAEDGFVHIPIGKTRLIASICQRCHAYIAYSPNPKMLNIAEKVHKCPRIVTCFPNDD